MKDQKGITLVALVITIIVMLILVAVTITIALQGNLFTTTQDAAKKTNNAMSQEQGLANGQVNVDNHMVDINAYSNLNYTPPAD